MSKEYNLKLDLKRPSYERLCGFKIGDSLAVINGVMLQNSTSYNLTGLTLRVNFKDSEGNLYFQDATKGVSIINPLEGTFKIDVLSSVLKVEGIIKADISIFKGTQKLTSSTFSMEVVETVYKDGAIIGANGKDLLQEVVEGEAKRITSELKREESEVVREKGEAKREEKEVVRESNEVIREKGYSKMDTRIDNLVLGQGNITEVVDAHLDGVSNKVYPTLKARLDHTSKQLFDSSLSTLTTSNVITFLENATDGLVQIESIRGKTLQDLCDLDVAGASTGIPPNDAFARLNKSPNLTTGKTITLINNNDKKVRYSFSINGAESSLHDLEAYKSKKVTLKENEIMRFMVFFKRDGWTEINVKASKGFMLEGDYTTVSQPTYFDGIKSVGESEGNKIELLSVGKNLFDKATITKGVIFIANTGGTSSKPDGYISDYINVLPNTKYVLKHGLESSAFGHCFYSSDKVYIGGIVSSAGYDTPQVITIPDSCAYIRTSGLFVRLDTQQLEKSDILTPYENFQSDKVEISLGSPLCGLPNGIADEIIGNRVHRRIGKDILNGTSTWALAQATETIATFTKIKSDAKKSGQCICDKFPIEFNNTKEGAYINSYGAIVINILKSKLATPDVVGFKKWLNENNTTIYYELAEQTISSVNSTSLKSFKDGSIILNNAITPIIDLKYPTSISGRLSSVETILDNTVDRTKKLEEGLLTTVTQVIDNKNKIEQLDLDIDALEETLKPYISSKPITYQSNFIGDSIIYKSNHSTFMDFAVTLPNITTDTLVLVGNVPVGFRPATETNIIVAESAGTGMALVNITKSGDIRIRKFGATAIKNIRGNVNYITNN